jgi:hypothetical protein
VGLAVMLRIILLWFKVSCAVMICVRSPSLKVTGSAESGVIEPKGRPREKRAYSVAHDQ